MFINCEMFLNWVKWNWIKRVTRFRNKLLTLLFFPLPYPVHPPVPRSPYPSPTTSPNFVVPFFLFFMGSINFTNFTKKPRWLAKVLFCFLPFFSLIFKLIHFGHFIIFHNIQQLWQIFGNCPFDKKLQQKKNEGKKLVLL